MSKLLTVAAVAALMSAAAATGASAWDRHSSVSGWRGTATASASGGCAGGTCSRSAVQTGPYGYSRSRQGSVSCNSAAGSCSGGSVTTTRAGNTITRTHNVHR